MQDFDEAHRAVHYPEDRRFRVRIAPRFVIAIAALAIIPFASAWVWYWVAELPIGISIPTIDPNSPYGFPLWLRLSHFLNFLS